MNLFALNEAKISYSLGSTSKHPKVDCSKTIYDLLLPNWEDIDHVETFYAAYLSRSSKLLCFKLISKGGISGTVCDPKIVFQSGLLCNASSVILAHNHPSGNLQPSESDRNLTKKIKLAGGFLDMIVLDHVIASSDGYYSFADEGFM